MTRRPFIPPEIRRALRSGALFVINHSGGKDSQAMTAVLRRIVPSHQLLVVYAHLPEVVWPDTEAHIRATTRGLEYHRVEADKTFFDLVEARGMFPSPRYRQCTSDLKRGPIHKWLRRYCKAHGIHQVVQCLGMRAEESTDRARRKVLKLDKRLSKAGRSVYEWLPIHGFTTGEVFATIAEAGQKPHWAYAAGPAMLGRRASRSSGASTYRGSIRAPTPTRYRGGGRLPVGDGSTGHARAAHIDHGKRRKRAAADHRRTS